MSILPKRKQWLRHQGTREREKRLHRMRAQASKVLGVQVDEQGRTPAALIVPGFETGRRPSMGGR